MKYYVRTDYAKFESLYRGKRNTPYQGICQRNGSSPTYWLIVTIIMVLMMYKKGHAM